MGHAGGSGSNVQTWNNASWQIVYPSIMVVERRNRFWLHMCDMSRVPRYACLTVARDAHNGNLGSTHTVVTL